MVASAALAEILLLDPETLLEPVEPPFVQVTLIPADQTAAELVPIAINNRPEIASQRELLAAANQRLKQEKKRPFLPSLIITSNSTTTGLLAAGNLSAGPNAGLGANAPAANFEVAAVWQLQNAGLGNIGRIRQRRAEQDLASIEVTRILFRVRAEVAQALARLQTARARVPPDRGGIAAGDRVGRQELHRSTRDDAAGGRAASAGRSAAGSRRRPDRTQRGLRAILRGRQ